MINAIILFFIDLTLSFYLNEKAIFLAIPKYKVSKIIAAITLVFLVYTISKENYLLFLYYLILLRIIDKIIYIAKFKQ